ncbi:hypothetical protein AUR64_00710 [Haloprofundus marisrubri]|uniref:histidine kinase n=1 Tax=Haloprofundus marisrubri TaxID=1514971 RepID=A0A0W1R4H4_9EURY|nr:histidine kinase N-terminal 7TM domain-containing protein [Haloprofundus marisrubri]KTG08130.1 hypothetical protein AUR64_00710 [Haloprofundus marisrubri]
MISVIAVVQFGAAIVGAVLAIAAFTARRIPGTRWFGVLMAGVTVWAGAAGAQWVVSTPATVEMLALVAYLGIVVTPGAWVAFAVAYAGGGNRLTTSVVAGLAVEPVVVLTLAATNDAHGLLWSSTTVVESGLATVHGPAFWVHAAYSYLLLLSGTVVLLWTVVRLDLYKRHVALLLTGVALPWVANALYLSGWAALATTDPTPVALVGTGLCFATAVVRFRLLDTMPVVRELARDAALEDMNDGAVILDRSGAILDLNAAAEELCGEPRTALVDRPFEAVFPGVAYEDIEENDQKLLTTTLNNARRTFRVETSPVRAFRGHRIGRLVTLRDVTDRRIRQQRLEVQNRVLRHNLRNDMNVILGYLDQIADQSESEGVSASVERCRERGVRLVRQSAKARDVERLLSESSSNSVDLGATVDTVCAEFRDQYPDATITVTTPSADCRVRVDGSLSRIVSELVENAVTHGDGRVELTVDVDDDTGRVVVSDDGPGIPAHERAVLTTGRETALEHSSGLGLWLVKWTVARSGGSLDIRDGGDGCTVVFSVPRDDTGGKDEDEQTDGDDGTDEAASDSHEQVDHGENPVA